MQTVRSTFLAKVGRRSEGMLILSAIALGWYVFFGKDQLLALFLFPAFAWASVWSLFAIWSRRAINNLRAKFAAPLMP